MEKRVLFVRQPLDSSPNSPRPRVAQGASPIPSPSSVCVPDPSPVHQPPSPEAYSHTAPSCSHITRSQCHQSLGLTALRSQRASVPHSGTFWQALGTAVRCRLSPGRWPFSIGKHCPRSRDPDPVCLSTQPRDWSPPDSWNTQHPVCPCAGATVTEPQTGPSHNRNGFPHSSGSWRLEIKGSVGPGSL